MRIDLFFERVERFSDYIPGVSTITNLVALILKGTRYFFVERHIETNRYYQHLNDKSFARLVILLVPFLGNMAIGIYDFFKVRGKPAIQAQSAQLNFEESLTAWCNEKSGTDEYDRRLSAAEKIRICYSSQKTSLSLSGNHLTSFPDAIVQLTHLTHLDLFGNRLAFFPDAIVQLTHLTYLDLSCNHLTSLSDAIVQLTHLTHLSLSCNYLTSFPDAICQLTHLTDLSLSDNHLTSFPDAIVQLTHLTHLSLSYNQLASLPNQVVELPSTCSIDLMYAGLSENILLRLRAAITLRESRHLSVPRIEFSMPAPHSERGQSIDEMIHSLYLIIEKTPSDLSLLKAADTDNYLSMWLNRLSWTASYQIRGETQKRFVANIINYLEEAARNPEFCKLFIQLIVEASDTCGDRVALSVITVGIQHALATFDISDTKGLADFVIRGGMAMGLLEYYARDVVSKLSFVDEIEVYLGLPIMLKERLHLPINIQEMLYFGCSSLTQAHLADAEKFVRGQIDDPEARKEFLIHNDIWLKALSKKYPEEFARIRENYLLDQNEADEGAVWKIRKTYETALKRLTERAIS